MKGTTGLVTGLAIVGAAAGATYLAKSKKFKGTRRSIMKTTSRAMKNASTFLDGFSYMLK